jgi:hypothetical protein
MDFLSRLSSESSSSWESDVPKPVTPQEGLELDETQDHRSKRARVVDDVSLAHGNSQKANQPPKSSQFEGVEIVSCGLDSLGQLNSNTSAMSIGKHLQCSNSHSFINLQRASPGGDIQSPRCSPSFVQNSGPGCHQISVPNFEFCYSADNNFTLDPRNLSQNDTLMHYPTSQTSLFGQHNQPVSFVNPSQGFYQSNPTSNLETDLYSTHFLPM